MTFYLDTSIAVSFLTREAQSPIVTTWIRDNEARGLASSPWVTTEFSSALSMKLRMGRITASDRAAALAQFARLTSNVFATLAVDGSHFRLAAQFLNQEALGLRSGDALHLAIAASHGATLCTLDRKQAEADPALGVSTRLI